VCCDKDNSGGETAGRIINDVIEITNYEDKPAHELTKNLKCSVYHSGPKTPSFKAQCFLLPSISFQIILRPVVPCVAIGQSVFVAIHVRSFPVK